ncbi:MAG: hypothetical protein E8D47_04645 [Nitrospira sp.]|nr:MAG: hypothetical protein E8D47_04645 [Nitrospira sp.]
MRRHSSLILLFLVLLLSQQGCVGAVIGPAMGLMRLAMGGDASGTAYVPTITLAESPRTIEAHARLGSFETNIPQANPETARRDQEVTQSMMEGDLADLVRQAVLADFRMNLVYSNIRLHEKHPDLVIQGHIYQFSEYRSKPWYAKTPLIGRLFSDTERIEGGVSLDLMVMTPDGVLIGMYTGQSRFPTEVSPTQSLPKNQRTPGQSLNRAFTEAVRQIRAQMLADEQLSTRTWSRQPINGHAAAASTKPVF